jgi:hypothetical protein
MGPDSSRLARAFLISGVVALGPSPHEFSALLVYADHIPGIRRAFWATELNLGLPPLLPGEVRVGDAELPHRSAREWFAHEVLRDEVDPSRLVHGDVVPLNVSVLEQPNGGALDLDAGTVDDREASADVAERDAQIHLAAANVDPDGARIYLLDGSAGEPRCNREWLVLVPMRRSIWIRARTHIRKDRSLRKHVDE